MSSRVYSSSVVVGRSSAGAVDPLVLDEDSDPLDELESVEESFA